MNRVSQCGCYKMGFSEWVQETNERIKENGRDGISESLYEFWVGMLRRTDAWVDPGENYYERDWDVLVILDATRLDALESVSGQYDFIDKVETIRSPGSATYEWMQRTFTDQYDEEISETYYITANPFTEKHLEMDRFYDCDEVWREAWDTDIDTVPARAVTDRAITAAREANPKRMILHYLQPHVPFVPDPTGGDKRPPSNWGDDSSYLSPWQRLRKGELSEDRVWDGYIRNLEYVLDDIELLRKNIDAEKMVVTTDHGNAIGEWGIYGHPNVPLSCLRNVPWVETTATDSHNYSPDHNSTEQGNITVGERLEKLGYR